MGSITHVGESVKSHLAPSATDSSPINLQIMVTSQHESELNSLVCGKNFFQFSEKHFLHLLVGFRDKIGNAAFQIHSLFLL